MSMELRREAEERRRERELLEGKREQFSADLRTLAQTGEGRRVFRWILERGNIFRSDYEPGIGGAYAAGRKAAALDLWHSLQASLPRAAFLDIALPPTESHSGERQTDESREAPGGSLASVAEGAGEKEFFDAILP